MPKFNLYRKMLGVILIMLIPIIVLYVYSNKTSTEVLRAELEKSNRDQLKFFQQQMDTSIHSVSQWPNLLINDPDISNLKDIFEMKSDYLDLNTIELIKRIQKKLSIQENSVNWQSKLKVYSPALKRVITSSNVYTYDPQNMIDQMEAGWKVSSQLDENKEQVYSFSLMIASPYSSFYDPGHANLIIEVEFNSNNIVSMLNAFRGDGNRSPFYYVRTNELIYHSYSDRAFIDELLPYLKLDEIEQSDYKVVELNGDSYLVNMERSTTTGWILIDYLPLSEMLSPIKKTNMLFYASVLTLLLMSIVVVYFLYVQVQVPIKQLVTSFQRLKKEDYSVRLQPKGNTEFAFVFTRFNSMVTQIQELFQRSYLEQIHIREAKLKQLQAQINPHFFYNCFSFISSMAKLQNYQAIIAMSQNLSDYYRYTTRQEKEFVPMGEEVHFVKSYLDICTMRMKRLQYQIQVPAWLQQELVPPLIIQPLVENAIIHGIEPSIAASTIIIEVTEHNGEIIIRVEDDGKGLSDEEMITLERSLNYPMTEEMGCGLWNVHQRLSLRYGEHAGITLSRSKLGGLCVSIRWQTELKQHDEWSDHEDDRNSIGG